MVLFFLLSVLEGGYILCMLFDLRSAAARLGFGDGEPDRGRSSGMDERDGSSRGKLGLRFEPVSRN